MAYISFQPSGFFNPLAFVGNGATNHALTGVGFQPDFCWFKNREVANNHWLFDSVRGVEEYIESDSTQIETTATDGLKSFDADGFTVDDANPINHNTKDIICWNWKAGTTAVPSGGTITPSAVSFNTTNGFGIYAFTGTGSTASIAHGLGVKPDMIFVKRLNATGEWSVYHSSLGGYNNVVSLNTTAASWSDTTYFGAEPTASLFSVGSQANTNGSGDSLIAYVFTSIKGFSKFGSYTGSGQADGPFAYTGFRPAFVMIKNSEASETWNMWDSTRNPFNLTNLNLRPNNDTIENTATAPGGQVIDILSNGFKIRGTTTETNQSTKTMIYMAFAEFPLVSSNSKAGTAR